MFGVGKPFEAAAPGALDAETRDLPLPSTLAGAIRNEVARQLSWTQYTEDRRDQLNSIAVRGPVLCVNGELCFPSPADCALVEIEDVVHCGAARPSSASTTALLPDGIVATALGMASYEPSKAAHLPYWSVSSLVDWLIEPSAVFRNAEDVFGHSVPVETRIHVAIDSQTRRHRDGHLFSTQGAVYGPILSPERSKPSTGRRIEVLNPNATSASSLSATSQSESVIASEWCEQSWFEQVEFDVLTLGGFRGLAKTATTSPRGWECPDAVRSKLQGAKRVRLQLATPGAFEAGWKPNLQAIQAQGLRLKLVSACVGRKQSGAGWLTHGGQPRPNRWLAPAGSVYFYEVEDGDAGGLADWWLQSVADNEQDCRDGFALALWGIWDYVGEK